jgi:hypothetical protein
VQNSAVFYGQAERYGDWILLRRTGIIYYLTSWMYLFLLVATKQLRLKIASRVTSIIFRKNYFPVCNVHLCRYLVRNVWLVEIMAGPSVNTWSCLVLIKFSVFKKKIEMFEEQCSSDRLTRQITWFRMTSLSLLNLLATWVG